jgi:hypothetical protein
VHLRGGQAGLVRSHPDCRINTSDEHRNKLVLTQMNTDEREASLQQASR